MFGIKLKDAIPLKILRDLVDKDNIRLKKMDVISEKIRHSLSNTRIHKEADELFEI